MKREIKFRVWDKNKKEWVNPNEALYIRPDTGEVEKTRSGLEICLSTGLLSKNGKEIWEGDIVKQIIMGHEVIAPMIWNQQKAQFGLDAEIDFDSPEHVEIKVPSQGIPEIIGNIYENPELLDKEKTK